MSEPAITAKQLHKMLHAVQCLPKNKASRNFYYVGEGTVDRDCVKLVDMGLMKEDHGAWPGDAVYSVTDAGFKFLQLDSVMQACRAVIEDDVLSEINKYESFDAYLESRF